MKRTPQPRRRQAYSRAAAQAFAAVAKFVVAAAAPTRRLRTCRDEENLLGPAGSVEHGCRASRLPVSTEPAGYRQSQLGIDRASLVSLRCEARRWHTSWFAHLMAQSFPVLMAGVQMSNRVDSVVLIACGGLVGGRGGLRLVLLRNDCWHTFPFSCIFARTRR